ncbi:MULTISPECIES: class I SAM-dependent methyltransferase [Streptomyces]|uniref:Methyltransferase n=1 Tax=Streptomyces alboflavus TaxID=67267 RepID=A0A1Z1WG60_9ACTN|nr:class I SAM-dependent methyltransferase [Streptomyces alboflavus]ARX85455.1 methyltransferase [Streptomyces alboflavus]
MPTDDAHLNAPRTDSDPSTSSLSSLSSLALSFDTVATQYATARPGYPPELLATIEELAKRPLAGATVVDVGAGTGIATRLLRDRGAQVIAVEPGPAMGAQLRASLPEVPLLRAVGDALPLADASADLVTYAQAFHWTDPASSVPEALRVLRPGGALAVWWNTPDPDVAWAAEQEARLKSRLPGYHASGISSGAPAVIESVAPGLTPTHRRLHWTRRVPLSLHLAHLSSRSYFANLGLERSAPVLADEQTHLTKIFPNGEIEEAYAVDLTVVRRPITRH